MAVNAKTGKPVPAFGSGGEIDLKVEMKDGYPFAQYGLNGAPMVYKNLVITGSHVQDGGSFGGRGDVRAWDARTGKLVWIFHAVPRPGEPGHETWLNDGWKDRSGANVWNTFSLDTETGTLFMPIGSPSNDLYGGDRPGANLFGNSMVAQTPAPQPQQRLIMQGDTSQMPFVRRNAGALTNPDTGWPCNAPPWGELFFRSGGRVQTAIKKGNRSHPMRNCFTGLMVVLFITSISVMAQTPAYRAPRLNGHPDLNGIWQAVNTANWDLQDHPAQPAPLWQSGAIGAAPAGQSVVEGGEIPYQPAALQKKKENFAKRLPEDPEAKCYMPGVPRATYMPYPFQIVQSQRDILFVYEYATANRLVNMGPPQKAGSDTWMGTSNGRWEGETLVVDVTGLNGLAWLDRAGDWASDKLHVVERYTRVSPDHIQYESTIEDPIVFTRPWKISMPLYRHVEKNAQLLEFKCVPFAEELLYGQLKKKTSN